MTPEQYAKVREVFQAAEELPPDRQRSFVLQQLDDPRLQREVLSLLEYHDRELALAEGATQRAEAGMTVVGQRRHASSKEPASLAELPSAVRVAQASQLFGKRRSWHRFWPIFASILVALVASLIAVAVERAARSQLVTVRQVQLQTIARSVGLTVRQWAVGKQSMVQTCTRSPQLQEAVEALSLAGRSDSPRELLLEHPARTTVDAQLRAAFGPQVRYVLWNRSGLTLASWQPDAADIGRMVPSDGLVEISRGFSGETLIHPPDRIEETTEGFEPEPMRPYMWVITPVRNPQGTVRAVLLVRGIGLRSELCEIFEQLDFESTGDAYAVDDRGIIRAPIRHTEQLRAAGIIPQGALTAETYLRAGDPGGPLNDITPTADEVEAFPLTVAASQAALARSGESLTSYRDYRGEPVIGVWRWLPELELGAIVEMSVDEAYAPLAVFRIALVGCVGILTLSAAATGFFLAHRTRELRRQDADSFGRYELLGELGSGGMGVVYRARHHLMKRPAALKIIRPDRLDQESTLRFDREVQLAAGLQSPHSVSLLDYGWTQDGRAYFAMELLDGITIHQAVQRSGGQSPGRVVDLLCQVCDSLSEAHARGLVHRDVKPRNIMLSHRGCQGDWAVLFDFGLAKPIEQETDLFVTRERIWAGTPMYMAPERFRNPRQTDPRSDLYSLAAVGYFMLAGRAPFAEVDPAGMFELILSTTPPPLETILADPTVRPIADVIGRAMAKEPASRPATAADFAAELRELRSRYVWTASDANRWWQQFSERPTAESTKPSPAV